MATCSSSRLLSKPEHAVARETAKGGCAVCYTMVCCCLLEHSPFELDSLPVGTLAQFLHEILFLRVLWLMKWCRYVKSDDGLLNLDHAKLVLGIFGWSLHILCSGPFTLLDNKYVPPYKCEWARFPHDEGVTAKHQSFAKACRKNHGKWASRDNLDLQISKEQHGNVSWWRDWGLLRHIRATSRDGLLIEAVLLPCCGKSTAEPSMLSPSPSSLFLQGWILPNPRPVNNVGSFSVAGQDRVLSTSLR
jgi:hypothetical protein